ncbi:MAG: TolC family protein, partial [Chthoniobacterales bacterium]
MIHRPLILLVLFPALSVMAGGESPPKDSAPGTIAHYEQLALVNNPTLRQAEAVVEGELAKAEQAGLYPNPTVGYMGEQIGATHEQYLESPGEFQGGFVQQRFVVPAKLDLSKKKYLARAEVSGFDREAQILSVRNDVRIHAYRVLGRQEHLTVQKELLESF